MTVEEINKVYDQFRAQGASDEDLVGMCYLLYQQEQIDTNQLKDMIKVLGYSFTPEFEAMSEEDKHEKGWDMKDKEDGEKSEGEDEKSEGEGEKIETDKKEEVKEEVEEDGDKEEEKVEEKSEDDERKEASNLYGLNLNKKQ